MGVQEVIADYVIVGAGSAGCVLASRLSADSKCSVVLIEAGGDDRPLHNRGQLLANLFIKLPVGFTQNMKNPRVTWDFQTKPDPRLGNRTMSFPRGKVIGGSSAINGMQWARGLPHDYDGWRDLGCTGWGWADVQPLFERIEHFDPRGGREPGIDLQRFPMKMPLLDDLQQAFAQAGAPIIDTINRSPQEGVSLVDMATRNGVRCSNATNYLHPAMKRDNLQVLTDTLVQRVLFRGTEADAVACERDGQPVTVRARREIILCAGSINTPKILELSGVGHAGRLQSLGIAVVANSPQVGESLQDHYSINMSARFKKGAPSFNRLTHGWNLVGQALKFAFLRSGILASSPGCITAYVKSEQGLPVPDLQMVCSPSSIDIDVMAKTGQLALEKEPGVTIGSYLMRPASRGSVHITTPDFRRPPEIVPNFLADDRDLPATVNGLRWTRSILNQPALAAYFDHEVSPGNGAQSGEELLAYARAAGATAYHQAGTCAMGSGPEAPLDPRLRVRGVSRLRVVDASVMPVVVSGNTNAATTMIAEKAADMIISER